MANGNLIPVRDNFLDPLYNIIVSYPEFRASRRRGGASGSENAGNIWHADGRGSETTAIYVLKEPYFNLEIN